jgi:hypothetical protein
MNRKKNTCNCNSENCSNKKESTLILKKTGRTIPSIILSIIVAFFPKCPICWAVYMSMLGSFGIAEIPYMRWLLPVFLAFLAFHLWLLYKKVPQKGYGPFLLSVLGFSIMLLAKFIFITQEWLAIFGMGFILFGSLWNSFSMPKTKLIIN